MSITFESIVADEAAAIAAQAGAEIEQQLLVNSVVFQNGAVGIRSIPIGRLETVEIDGVQHSLRKVVSAISTAYRDVVYAQAVPVIEARVRENLLKGRHVVVSGRDE